MKERKYYVYEWIRLDINEPFYVGKGCGNRWCNLKRDYNNHFNNIVKSIPVAVNILHDNLAEKESLQYEIWYIHKYKYEYGYNLVNIDDGGSQPPTFCGEDSPTKRPEVREKISESLKIAFANIELRKYLSQKQHEYCISPRGKTERSNRSKKIMENKEVRKKIKDTNIKTWNNKELKNKHSQIMKLCYNNEKSAEISKKHIVQLDIYGNKIGEYLSLKQAEIKTGVKFKGISKVLRGKCKTYGGYIWVYYEDYTNNNYVIKVPKKIINKGKVILQLSLNNEIINKYIYPNTGEYKNTEVLRVCKGERKSYKSYKWMYCDEYIKTHNKNELQIAN